jgi:cytochrome oxidase Cu insertion factor (SCO1/SenC/PrrC family)
MRRWLVAGALVLAIAAGVALAAVLTGHDSGRAGAGEGAYRGSEPPGGIMMPTFTLRTYSGRTVSTAGLRGHVVLLTFLDSQCTEACPVLAAAVARAIDELTPSERRRVRAVAITTDPVEDTPASVRRFLAARSAVGRLDYVIGSVAELRPVWQAFQILPSFDTGRDDLHSAPLRVYSTELEWVATLHASADLTQENLLHDIRVVLSADS